MKSRLSSVAASMLMLTFSLTACEGQKAREERLKKEKAERDAEIENSRNVKTAQQAIDKVVTQISDPESADFRNVSVRKGGLVCGEVNAKNRVGGYVGFKKFAVNGQSILVNQDAPLPSADFGGNIDYEGQIEFASAQTIYLKISDLCDSFDPDKKLVSVEGKTAVNRDQKNP